MNIELFNHKVIKPFASFGIDNLLFDVHLDTLIYTWISMIILFTLSCAINVIIRKNVLNTARVAIETSVDFFSNLCIESLGFFNYYYFAFASTLFLFTLGCNLVGLLPFCDEATKDLNTALALGLSSFCYVQYQHIRKAGFIEYLKAYTRPAIFVTPIEIISKFASIISMSFRLFGNILGGSIVYMIMVHAVGAWKEYFIFFSFSTLGAYVVVKSFIDIENNRFFKLFFRITLGMVFFLAALQMFFGVFEGFVQAFVLTMLTFTYLSLALSGHESQEELQGVQV